MLHTVPFLSCALKYKVIFFDAYGVLKNHQGIIPGVKETIRFLRENGIGFYVLTNDASRSPAALAAFYNRRGIGEISEDKIISSGMLAREFLQYKLKKG
ncbi:MAG: TIGR01459 family HAD-type hydrolase, partial [Bacteroidetes bacterium]